ncbi:MAG: hypothetical protein CMJ83_08490 [Planctomycetes bacterium]|nr:hypothetical protein [Planctomycetota bacterium]
MIGFFKRVFELTEVHRRRRRARLDTTPRSTVELCRLLQRRGRVAAARDVARDGLLRFPASADLRDILHSTWQRSTKKRVNELQQKVDADPSIENYVALIEHLQEFDETDRATEVSRQLVQKHPDDAAAALVSGRILIARFHRDHVAQDGALGLRSMQRAAELDPQSFEAHFALAETNYYIGAVSKALQHLYQALDVQPEHTEANRLYRILTRLPLEKQQERELLREVEENDEASFRFQSDAASESGDTASPTKIASGLEQLSLLAGVRRTVLSHRGVEAVAQEGRQVPVDDETGCLLELARGFRRTASLSAKRMGIGAFEEAEMSFDTGTILAFGSGSTILMIETEGASRLATIAAEARHYLAGSAVREPETAHA